MLHYEAYREKENVKSARLLSASTQRWSTCQRACTQGKHLSAPSSS